MSNQSSSSVIGLIVIEIVEVLRMSDTKVEYIGIKTPHTDLHEGEKISRKEFDKFFSPCKKRIPGKNDLYYAICRINEQNPKTGRFYIYRITEVDGHIDNAIEEIGVDLAGFRHRFTKTETAVQRFGVPLKGLLASK